MLGVLDQRVEIKNRRVFGYRALSLDSAFKALLKIPGNGPTYCWMALVKGNGAY